MHLPAHEQQVLAILAEGAALVFGGLQGIYLAFTGNDTFTVTVAADRRATSAANPRRLPLRRRRQLGALLIHLALRPLHLRHPRLCGR
ncbi:hypothetical protein [Actinokineospora terrae]|uniref:hypothetical protein n=1 Tax=Actinokineospora terrae TaxID=155974 RepID=UPI0011606713|nr:hypothetical protein [Actinokineospora terrae]